MKTHFIGLHALLAVTGGVWFLNSQANAADGTWLGISGDWGQAGTWSGGTIADGADFTANFTGVNITADQIINLDGDRTIGNITFTDSTSSHNLTISGTGILTMDRTDLTKPTINITQAGRLLTINSVIAGNDGLLKSGAGTLVFGAESNNTFTGGFDISAGVVNYSSTTHANAWGNAANVITFTGNATLHNADGAYTLARGIAVNSGVTATLSGAFGESTNITGAVTGDGDVNISGGSNGWAVTMSNAANSMTGTIWVSSNSGQNTTLAVNSLADGAAGKKLKMGAGTATASFTLQGSSVAPIVWDNRTVELAGTTGAISIINNSTNAARTLTINPNLTFTAVSSGNKTLTFDGSNTGVNTFAGNITNNGSSTTAITKTGAGTWALGGTNTYSGVTNLAASGTTGRLVFQGVQSLSANTSLVFAQSSSAVQSVRFLDDGTGTINFARPISFGGTNTTQNLNIFVGNNHTANLGSNALSSTTDSTIQVGSITFTSTATDTNTTTINVTGANGYRLETGTITLNNLVTRTAGATTVTAINPTSANMTIAAITMATGNTGIANDGVPVIRLTGTSADNIVTGAISDASDFATGQVLSLQKQGVSKWTLLGDNTYTGSTTISAGVLEIAGSGRLGGGNYAANISVAATSSGSLIYNSSSNQTLSGVISGAGTLVKNNSGILTLTNASNSLSGGTTISGGILAVNGSGILGTSAVTINGGNFRYNSTTNFTNTLTFTSGTISGTNWNGSLGAQTIGTNQTISPGNSPGTATTTSQTWAAGGTYVWEINNVTGTAGSDPGWDLINGTGTLTITASIGTEFIIDITSLTLGNIAGDAVNFDQMLNYAWLIADFAAVTGFNATDFIVDATGFNNNTFTGAFAVALGDSPGIGGDNSQIWVTYTAIPEPKAALLGCLGILLLLRRRR